MEENVVVIISQNRKLDLYFLRRGSASTYCLMFSVSSYQADNARLRAVIRSRGLCAVEMALEDDQNLHLTFGVNVFISYTSDYMLSLYPYITFLFLTIKCMNDE